MREMKRFGFWAFAWLWLLSVQAQPGGVPMPADRTVSPQAWQNATAHLDYSRDTPEEEPGRPPVEQLELSQYDWEKGLLYGISVLLLVAVGWWLFQIKSGRVDPDPDVELVMSSPAEPENANGPPLPGECRLLLQQALAAQEYRQAVRAHFLLLIGSLAQRGAIRWAVAKTNAQYVGEMKSTSGAESFRSAVEMFERIWYGQMPVDRRIYETAVAPLFDILLSSAASVSANSGDTR
jgi:hypothetical protein